MPEFYFFTDLDLLDSKNTNQAFGPVNGNENTQYRVCSLHQATSDPNAYAVGNGIVQVQDIPNTSPQLVNLIMVPEEQGAIDGIRVKYFVYRGIKKASLINSSDNEVAAPSNNDLTQDIWNNLNTYHVKASTSGNPSSDILGEQYNSLPGNEDIDFMFYDSASPYCPPRVKKGWSIGTFDKNQFGFEIVISNIPLDNSLNTVRTLDHIINAAPFPGVGAGQQQKMENKAQREQILSYIDPAAYYGNHYLLENILAKNSSGIENKYFKDQLYSQILNTKFNNSKKIYYDIRNEKNFSYVYDDLYDYDSKIKDMRSPDSGSTSISVDYCTNDWPILIFENTSNNEIQNNPSDRIIDYARIAFGIVLNNNESTPKFCLNTGSVERSKSHILRPKNQSKFFDQNSLFVKSSGNEAFFNLSSISFPTIPYSDNNGTVVCNYLKFTYIRNRPNATNFVENHHIDYLFAFQDKPSWLGNLQDSSFLYLTGHERYVESNDTNLAGIYETGIAFEENRRIFYAFPKDYYFPPAENYTQRSLDNNSYPYLSFLKLLEDVSQGATLKKFELALTSGNIPFLSLRENLYETYWMQKEQIFLALALSNSEFQSIQTAINNNNFNTSIFPVLLGTSSVNQQTDNNDNEYEDLSLKISGWNNNGNYQNKNLSISNAYGDDSLIYATQAASSQENITISPTITTYTETDIQVETTSNFQNNNKIFPVYQTIKDLPLFKEYTKKIARSGRVNKIRLDIEYDISNPEASAITLPISSGPPDTVIIKFDEKDYLNVTTKIEVVQTFLHEMIHAYFNFLIAVRENHSDNIPGLLDFYNRFGTNDKAKEMAFQHNLMAFAWRDDIIKACKEYDKINGVFNRSGTLNFDDLISGSSVTRNYTTEEFYIALSWGGLVVPESGNDARATRTWREFASQNKTKAQMYLLLLIIENKGGTLPQMNPIPTANYILNTSVLDTI